MCKKEDERVMHIISRCSKLAKKEYEKRHDSMGKAIHWDLCRGNRFEHSAESVIENENWKFLWDL